MMYLDYNGLKKRIEDYKEKRKAGMFIKLPAYYMFTTHRLLAQLNIDEAKPLDTENVQMAIDIEQERLSKVKQAQAFDNTPVDESGKDSNQVTDFNDVLSYKFNTVVGK